MATGATGTSQINTGAAPICNGNPDQPKFKAPAPTLFNFSPPTTSEPGSVVTSIFQLQQALTDITNPAAATNLPATTPAAAGGAGKGAGAKSTGGGKKKKNQPTDDEWREKSRKTENVKVVNPDDDSQFVIVKEIVNLVFERTSTGETITIKRDPS
jgi:hypothetical protein